MGDYQDFKGTVIIYSVTGCSQCTKAKAILNQKHIPYYDISLDSFPQCHAEMMEHTGGDPSVPQIFFNQVLIGGVEELEELENDELQFDSLLEMLRNNESKNGPCLPNPESAVESIDENFNSPPNDILFWIPNEYTRLVNDMKKANIIKDNRVGLIKVYRNSFKGQDFIDWIMKERGIKTTEALEIGQELIDRHFGQQTSKEMGETFSPDRYYQLVEDDENKPLNSGTSSSDKILTAAEYNETLIKIIQPIYDDILTEENRRILYHKLVDNENFNRYLVYIRDLARVDLSNSTIEERLALMINIFNMMNIHITQKFGPPNGVWARRKAFNSIYYIIGGHNYALHSILNGILRGNKKANGYLWKTFGKQDLRLPYVIPDGETLCFFGINNGTISSSPIRTYSSNNVREELIAQAHYMLNLDECLKIDTKKNTIYLWKEFKWNVQDFGGSMEKVIEWVVEALFDCDSEKSKMVQRMFYTGEYKIDYIHYDWTFNGNERLPPRISQPKLELRQSGVLYDAIGSQLMHSTDNISSPISCPFENSYQLGYGSHSHKHSDR